MRIVSQQQVHTNDTIDKTYILMRIISQQQVHTNDTIDKISLNENHQSTTST